MKDKILYAASLFALSLSLVVGSYFTGLGINNLFSQKMPNLTNATKEEVVAWIEEKLLTSVEIIEEYNNIVDQNYVISQSIKPDVNISRSTNIIIYISKGSDPNELISLPDFTNKDIGTIQRWIKTNYLMNAEIIFEKSDQVEASYFIRSSINTTKIKRSDAITFVVSTGTQESLSKVIMINLVGFNEVDANRWANENGLTLILEWVYSDEVSENIIISQSVEKDTEVWKGSTIPIVISKGKSITLPNFYGMSKPNIDQFIQSNQLLVSYSYQYHNTINADYAISMSPSAYAHVEKGTTVNIILSLGRIVADDMVGWSQREFEDWIQQANLNGAQLTYEYLVDTHTSDLEPGLISRTDIENSTLDIGGHLMIYLSQGTLVSLPDTNEIIGQPVDTVKPLLEKLKLNVVIEEVESIREAGTVLAVEPLPNTVLKPGDTVKLTVAKAQP